MGKIHQKYLTTVTGQTLSPREVLRSPGWHMKDNGHTYLFCAIYFFDNKPNFGTRLDQTRNLELSHPILIQCGKSSHRIWLNFLQKRLISLTLRDSIKQNFGHISALGFLPLGQGCVKLGGVGPVDNRPSSNKLHHFVRKKEKKKKRKNCDT